MSVFSQRSFSGGEIAPSLYARADQAKYASGLRTCRNFLIMRHGGASNRPGTGFVAEVKDSTKTVRLIPFVFNASQTYVLEFGNLYMRVHKNGAQVVESAVNITDITQASPAVVTTSGAHGYSNGDEVYIASVTGMTQVNGRNFKVSGVTGTTFELRYMDATTAVNSVPFTTYAAGGNSSRVYQITTPYVEADLQEIYYAQSADVITLTHPTYEPRELSRTADTSWTLAAITFEPGIARPTTCAGTGSAGAVTTRYKITAVSGEDFEESLPGTEANDVITNITQANPGVVTTSGAHGYSNGDEVLIKSVVGMTQVNNRVFVVAGVAATTFQLKDTNTTSYTAYSSAGTSGRTSIVVVALAAAPASAIALTWDAITEAKEYNVYKETGLFLRGVYGFIGVAQSNAFNDEGTDPDTTDTPPVFQNPFLLTGNYPSTVSYYQQRLMLANTDNNPESVFGSQTASFKNFSTRFPVQSDDAVSFTLAGRQVNEVRHMVDLGTLLILTSGGEWQVQGDGAGILTPSSINAKQQGYNGATTLPPLVVGGSAIYVQSRGSVVRDLGFDFQIDGYRGNDLTIFSSHLFDGYTLRDWTFQQIPHSIIWAARSDGTLLGLTYIREHQVFAWHRHDFDGTVEQVCSVPEGTEDALYIVVKRTISGLAALGGSTRRYIERLKTRAVDDIEDSVFLDSSLSYNGENTNTTHTMTLSGGTNWTYTETLTLTSSAAFFTTSDVGNQIFLTGSGGDIIRFTIVTFSSSTVVTGTVHKTVPVSMRNTAMAVWSEAVDQVSGLWHLEGETVGVFGDGFVVASPNNAAYDGTTVTIANGIATLEKPYAVIHVGMPYISDIETLDIDTVSGETLSDKKKLVSKVTMFVETSRGIFVGPKPPTDDDDDPLEGLYEVKIRETEGYDEPVDLTTGTVDVNIKPEWNANGRVFVRQVDPVPLSVLSIVPAGLIPFRG